MCTIFILKSSPFHIRIHDDPKLELLQNDEKQNI